VKPIGKVAAKMVAAKTRADRVAVTRRVDLPVGDCVASVLEAEGAVQLIWGRFDAAEPGRALMNDFVTAEMAGQLRRLADAVEAADQRRER
jgi:hypothetical protein